MFLASTDRIPRLVAAWAGHSSSRTLAWNSDVLHCAQQLQAAAGRGYNPLRDTGQGCMAGWQGGSLVEVQTPGAGCMWRLPGGQVWAGGGVARVQLVSRCWVWPGCVSNMKDMTCASSSRARPDPDKWPPAQPSPASPASPAQAAILQAAGDCAVCPPAPPQQAGCLCWWWPSLCLTAARSVTSHQQQPSLSPASSDQQQQGEPVTRSPRPQCGGWRGSNHGKMNVSADDGSGPRPPELTARHKPWSWQQQHLDTRPRPSPVLAR